MASKGKYTYEYPHPAVAADCVIFGYDGRDMKVLLVKRGKETEASTAAYVGEWALPGGFLDVFDDKTVAHTASRELKEETGLDVPYFNLKEFNTYSLINRDPRERIISVAHYALVKLAEVKGDTDAERAEWFSLGDVPHLAFDHDKILRDASAALRERIHFEPVGFELLPEVFTMPQLQNLYESVLGVRFDRRNFAAKILKLGILEPTGDRPDDAPRSVPVQYRFNSASYEQMKSRGFRLEF